MGDYIGSPEGYLKAIVGKPSRYTASKPILELLLPKTQVPSNWVHGPLGAWLFGIFCVSPETPFRVSG